MITSLLVLAAASLFVNMIAILIGLMFLVMAQRDSKEILTLTKVVAGRIDSIDRMLTSLHGMFMSDMTSSNNAPPDANDPNRVFRTEDGRHQADNFEELMHKIASDDRYRVANPEDMNKLRKSFEDYQSHAPVDPDEHVPGDEWKEDTDEFETE